MKLPRPNLSSLCLQSQVRPKEAMPVTLAGDIKSNATEASPATNAHRAASAAPMAVGAGAQVLNILCS